MHVTQRGSAVLCLSFGFLDFYSYVICPSAPRHGLTPTDSPRREFLLFSSGLVPDDSGANFSVILPGSCT